MSYAIWVTRKERESIRLLRRDDPEFVAKATAILGDAEQAGRLVNGDAHIFVPIGLSDDELERMRAIALAEKEGKVKVEMRVRLTVEVPEGATEDDVHDVSVRIRTFLQHDFDDDEASIFGVGKVGYAYEALAEKEGR